MLGLLQTLTSIKANIYRIIILNNNSSDQTNSIINESFGFPLDLISSEVNVGLRKNLIKSYSVAINKFDYDYVWILSDDDYLDTALLKLIVHNLIEKKTDLFFLNHSVRSGNIQIKNTVLSKDINSYYNLKDIFRTDGPQFMLLGSMIYSREILEKHEGDLNNLIINSEITLPFRFAMFFRDYKLSIINYPELFINDQTEISWVDQSHLVYRKYLLIDLFKLFIITKSFDYILDIFYYIKIKLKKT